MGLTPPPGRVLWASVVIGVALSGFFDGILLHQVLQWHHLLSALGRDMRFQVAADGYFHVAMYAVALWGLWLLWSARTELAHPLAGGRLGGGLMMGFGAWNIVDVGLFHWMLGLHHIRMDSEQPLLWDWLWFVALGVVPLALGLARLRLSGPERGGLGPTRTTAGLTLLVACAGVWASQRPASSDYTTVLFAPGARPETVMAAVAAVDGQIVSTDTSGELVFIRTRAAFPAWTLLRRGAILVDGRGLPPGCFSWAGASGAPPIRPRG